MTTEPILVTVTEKPFYVYTNPSFSKLLEIGPLLRFTAYNKNKIIYVWNYYSGFHTHVSVGLKFLENFNSVDFLRGHAGNNNDETYKMVGSDFLTSFIGKMTNKDKVFLNNLLNQDWGWVDDYIKITG
jgi:hypothetical protein